MFRPKTAALGFAPVFLLLLLFSSCAARLPTEWDDCGRDAEFVLVFPDLCKTGEVRCAGNLTDGVMTLTVLSPARSAGIRVVQTAAGCTLDVGEGRTVRLAEDTAAGICAVYRLLTENGGRLTPSAEGDAYIAADYGTLTFDKDLTPVSVTVPFAGGERTIQVENYRISAESKTGQEGSRER